MRTTVKTWLKSQEKAKTDGHDKPEAQDEAVVQPNTAKPLINGDIQPDVVASAEVVADDRQPPSEAVESEDIAAADLRPSIEVTSLPSLSFPYPSDQSPGT
jgi:hypothetical protein